MEYSGDKWAVNRILLFIFFLLLHLLYRGWNHGTLCMRVTPFSEGKYIFRLLCSNPLQWEKDLLSQSFSLSHTIV